MANVGHTRSSVLSWSLAISHWPLAISHLRPMRLALVTRRYPPLIGGAERVLSYLAPALAAEGAEVDVLTARIDGLPASFPSPVGWFNGDWLRSVAEVPLPLDPPK